MTTATYEQLCEVLEANTDITTFTQLSTAMCELGYTGATQDDITMAFGYINQFRHTKTIIFA